MDPKESLLGAKQVTPVSKRHLSGSICHKYPCINHLAGTFPSSVCLACLHKSSVLPWQGLGTLSACLDALDLVAVHNQLVLLTNLHFVLELAVHGVVPSRDGTLTAGSGRQEEPCVSSLDLDGLCWLLRLGKIKTQPTHPTALLPAKANCCAKHFI